MEKKKSTKLSLIVMGVLIAASIVARACVIGNNTVSGIPMVVSLIFTAFYGFWLYKKPHGNMLKYAMLIFAAAVIISAVSNILAEAAYIDRSKAVKLDVFFKIAKILCAAAICYCAGRLNKITRNKYYFLIIDAIFLVESVAMTAMYPEQSPLMVYSYFNVPIVFTTLVIAYLTRYIDHKEAGLVDAPKK